MDSQTKQVRDFWNQLEQALAKLRDSDLEELSVQGERVLHAYRKRLREIDTNLTVNFERRDAAGPLELVFGCDGFPESIHNVLNLVNSAPDINGYQVKAFNERMNPVPQKVHLDGDVFSIDDYWCSLRVIHNRIELAIYMNDTPEMADMDPRIEAVMILLDALIGEYEIMTKIWALDWYLMPIDPLDYGLMPLTELREAFDEIKGQIKPLGIQLH